jgi:MinD superfamily P-loop ATPase
MLYANPESIFLYGSIKDRQRQLRQTGLRGQKTDERVAPEETTLAIIDGSPGIGCPVIASLSGVDTVLFVAEPSLSGISDLEWVVKTARNFQLSCAVCIN